MRSLFVQIVRSYGVLAVSLATHVALFAVLASWTYSPDRPARFPGGRAGGAIVLHEGAGHRGYSPISDPQSTDAKPHPAFHPGLALPKPITTLPTSETLPQQKNRPDRIIEQSPLLAASTSAVLARPRVVLTTTSVVQGTAQLARAAVAPAPPASVSAPIPVSQIAIGMSGGNSVLGKAGSSDLDGTETSTVGRGNKGSGTDAYDSALGASGDGQGPNMSGNPKPFYPELARLNRWQGTVLLRLAIAADGRVTDVQVEHSSGYSILDDSARAAVIHWRGIPANRGGRPIAVVETQEIVFRLP